VQVEERIERERTAFAIRGEQKELWTAAAVDGTCARHPTQRIRVGEGDVDRCGQAEGAAQALQWRDRERHIVGPAAGCADAAAAV